MSLVARLPSTSDAEIKANIAEIPIKITVPTNKSVWIQFQQFCVQRHYKFDEFTPISKMVSILKDWAYNLRRSNGDDGNEGVIISLWNRTASLLQEMYSNDFNIRFDPFYDVEFKSARDARTVKRKWEKKDSEADSPPVKIRKHNKLLELKLHPVDISQYRAELLKIVKCWDEETPNGLQRRFFHIAAFELGWRSVEASNCLMHYFRTDLATGRLEYNRKFSGSYKGPEVEAISKWLTPNVDMPSVCPVRLFDKLISKRAECLSTDRLFLQPNPRWSKPNNSGWYKDSPVGMNTILKWMKEIAVEMDVKPDNSKVIIVNETVNIPETEATGATNTTSQKVLASMTVHDLEVEEPETKHCRTCLAALTEPRNLHHNEHKHLLEILECISGMKIDEVNFEICGDCESRLKLVIQIKDDCLKSMQKFDNLRLVGSIKQEPLDIGEETVLDISSNSSHAFENVFVKEEPNVVDGNKIVLTSPETQLNQNSVDYTVTVFNSPQALSSNISNKSSTSTSISKPKHAPVDDLPPTDEVQFARFPKIEVQKAIIQFNATRNSPERTSCLHCDYVTETAIKLADHMGVMHSKISDERDSDVDISCTSPELEELLEPDIGNLIPEKSKRQYERTYEEFTTWCKQKTVQSVTENILLAYLVEKSQIVKSSTLWSIYSMLKCMLNIREGVDIKTFLKVVPFLKKKSVGYRAKKSNVFAQEEINSFIREAADEKFLLFKVVLIMGIAGALQRDELTNITIDDIQDANFALIVRIPNGNTVVDRTFTVTNPEYIQIYRKYAALRPTNIASRRFFVRYQNGKCTAQVVGIHKIGEIPRLIAKSLGLPNSELYTGHCYRRTSTTLSAKTGSKIYMSSRKLR